MNHDHQDTACPYCVGTKNKATARTKSLTNFCTIFTAAVVIQSLHMVEHVAQVIQKFALGREEAHGLIGMFDFEWVHFAYNAALIITLYLLMFRCSRLLRAKGTGLFYIFGAGVALQSYHMFEHIIKIGQHIQTGEQGTLGFIGNFVNPVWFHFWINLIVLALIVIPFFGLKAYKCAPAKQNHDK